MFLLLRTSGFTVRGDTTFKKEAPRGAYYEAEFKFQKTKGVRTILFVLLFTRLALQGIVCYTFSIYYRVVI